MNYWPYYAPVFERSHPQMSFATAKTHFETAYLSYYGQTVSPDIDESTSQYTNGAWIFNSADQGNGTVINFGRFRDSTRQLDQPFGSEFNTEPGNPPGT